MTGMEIINLEEVDVTMEADVAMEADVTVEVATMVAVTMTVAVETVEDMIAGAAMMIKTKTYRRSAIASCRYLH
ncbi:hypothetical protein ACLKA6_015631 [Drosophila palustris]